MARRPQGSAARKTTRKNYKVCDWRAMSLLYTVYVCVGLVVAEAVQEGRRSEWKPSALITAVSTRAYNGFRGVGAALARAAHALYTVVEDFWRAVVPHVVVAVSNLTLSLVSLMASPAASAAGYFQYISTLDGTSVFFIRAIATGLVVAADVTIYIFLPLKVFSLVTAICAVIWAAIFFQVHGVVNTASAVSMASVAISTVCLVALGVW